MHYALGRVFRFRAFWIFAIAALNACGHAAPSPSAGVQSDVSIDVAVDPTLAHLRVESCRGEDPCRHVNVPTHRRTGSITRDPMRLGQTLLLPTSYFMQPIEAAARIDGARLHVHVPMGMEASLPFALDDDEYLLTARDFRFDGFAVFGRFEVVDAEVVGTALSIVLPEEAARLDHDMIRTWLSGATETVGKLTGTFPVSRAQVIVVAVPSASSVVPFGMAFRAGGASVLLFTSSNATEETLARDWVAVHELTHLTLPSIREADAWFSEGYATYYQEVLRAIAGTSDASSVRHAIADAFERARNAGTGRTLADETRDRHTTRAYERIYWGGAAIMMLADIRYHEHGCGSLREAVRRASFSADDMARVFSAQEVIARLDGACGTNALRELTDAWLMRSDFPDVDPMHAAAMH